MSDKQQRIYDNATMLKALEQVDENLAIQAISTPNLDPRELSEPIECGLMGKIINKDTKEPMKFSNQVLMAGIRNRMNQIYEEHKNTISWHSKKN